MSGRGARSRSTGECTPEYQVFIGDELFGSNGFGDLKLAGIDIGQFGSRIVVYG